jgi:hypothetical protein
MADDNTTTAPSAPSRPEPDRSKSSYRSAPVAVTDSRSNGGSGVQRSHLRNRKGWLKSRTRAGQTWAQRKSASLTYCPAKVRAA